MTFLSCFSILYFTVFSFFGGNRYIYYFDCDYGFTDVYISVFIHIVDIKCAHFLKKYQKYLNKAILKVQIPVGLCWTLEIFIYLPI